MRRARDPIEHVRTLILEHEFAEPGDLKRMEKEIKKVYSLCLLCSTPAGADSCNNRPAQQPTAPLILLGAAERIS